MLLLHDGVTGLGPKKLVREAIKSILIDKEIILHIFTSLKPTLLSRFAKQNQEGNNKLDHNDSLP